MGLPNEPQGTQLFIDRDGNIRLDVHSSDGYSTDGYRPRRGHRVAQEVLFPYGDELRDDESAFSFAHQRQRLPPLTRSAAAEAGIDEAAVAVEELLLLERLKATGADAGLRAHLEETLQQQVHALGSNAAFVDATQHTLSTPWNHGVQGYLMAFVIGFGGFLGISIFICCARALYVKHMKKKLESQLAALQGTPEEQETSLMLEQQREEGWVDVSVQQQKPNVDEHVQNLATQLTMGPQQSSSKSGDAPDAPKSEKAAKKEKKDKEKKSKKEKKKKKHKNEEGGNDDKKSAKTKHKEKKEKELRKVLSAKRTLKLGA